MFRKIKYNIAPIYTCKNLPAKDLKEMWIMCGKNVRNLSP